MATPTHSSILAWRIPWTEQPDGLQSIGLHRIGHGGSDLAQMHSEIYIYNLKNFKCVLPNDHFFFPFRKESLHPYYWQYHYLD